MKLASIEKIIEIVPIEGADNIVLAKVLGWQVVVKKEEYKIGDLCIYIQIDTIVPETEQFEFLRERKFRIRTIKLRKQISQGLIIPVHKYYKNLEEGTDMTNYIGIKKYEKPDNNPILEVNPKIPKTWYKKQIYLFKYNILYKWIPSLRPKTRSKFPTYLVPITDEERIQNIPKVLENYKGKDFIVSYKLDGSSITIIHNKFLGISKYRICSRKFELHDKKNDWYKTFKENNFSIHIDRLVEHFKTNNIIVQGECIGKFNGNHHNLKKEEIRLFNIYVDGKRLNQNNLINICEKLLIPYCPLYRNFKLEYNMEEILKISDIPDIFNNKVPAEGLVWRDLDNTISFKVINNNYLLKEK